jgi:hypothetical protein
MGVERPELIKVVSNVPANYSLPDVSFAYHILYTYAHVFHIRQRGVVSDNEWTGWLRWMRTCFEEDKILEYWKGDLELEKWFDPAFKDFINKEIIPAIKENK